MNSLNKDTSIIVLNYQHWQDTIDCVDSLLELQNASFHVIIVDNFSTNDSYNILSKSLESISNNLYSIFTYKNHNEAFCQIINPNSHIKSISLLRALENKGYAAGNNVGLKYAQENFDSEYYWILNNDTKVHPNSLLELIQAAESEPKIGLWGTTLLEMNEPQKIQSIAGIYNKWTGQLRVIGRSENLKFLQKYPVILKNKGYPIGASLMVTKQFLRDVGLMNEVYFLYYEELDWQFRGIEKGWFSGVATKSWVWHKGSGTVTRTSPLADYFGLRSRLLWAKKYAPHTLFTLYIGLFLLFFNRISRGQYFRLRPLFLICFNPKMKYNIFFEWAEQEAEQEN